MSEELDRLLAKWGEYKKTHEELEQKLEKYKEKITKYLRENNLDKYENGSFTTKKIVQNRENVSKQSLPEELWKKYAVTKPVEFFVITKKKSPE